MSTGLLFQFFEGNQDLVTYGFIGNNGFKVVALLQKTIEPTDENLLKELEKLFEEIEFLFNKLMLNPFFSKEMFEKEGSLSDAFFERIVKMVEQIRIE